MIMFGFESVKEFFGKLVGKIPTKDAKTLAGMIDPEYNEHKNEDSFFLKAAGGVGTALLGWKLGSNFGTLGKLAGGVVGAWVGSKVMKELATDFGAAQDYCNKNKDANFLKAFGVNAITIGHKYDGTTIDADAGPDV